MNANAPDFTYPAKTVDRFARPALALCLALPWLNGLTAGPSPNFWPMWFAAVMGVAVMLFWRRVDARLLTQAWLAAALLSSVLALLQYFGLATPLAPWVSASAVGEAYGNLRQRNQFASLTSIGLVCLLALFSARRPRPASDQQSMSGQALWTAGKAYGMSGAAAMLLALGNAASSSRTGFLQWLLILAALLVAWAWQGRSKGELRRGRLADAIALALGASACYALLLALLPRALLAWQHVQIGTLAQRLAGSGQDSRLVLWDNVLHLIAQKPWLGWGWGELDYAHFITLYPGARFSELLDNAHNLPLQLAVELGLPIATAVMLFLSALLLRLKPWRERNAGRQVVWGVLGVIGVHSLLEYPLWYGPFHWAALLCVLWLWRTRTGAVATGDAPAALRHVRLKFAAAGLFWMMLAVVALDYARVSQRYLPAAERWTRDQQPWAGGTLFFQAQLDFARLTTTPLSKANAAEMHALALSLLNYSPEARVVEPLIASAILLGHADAAAFYLTRYRAAFPGAPWEQLLKRHSGWAQYLPS